MRLTPMFVLLLAALAVAPLTVTYVREWDAVDRCLDGGGSFDYDAMRCDHQVNHRHVAFAARRRPLVLGTGGALVGVLVAGLATWRRRATAAPPSRPVV